MDDLSLVIFDELHIQRPIDGKERERKNDSVHPSDVEAPPFLNIEAPSDRVVALEFHQEGGVNTTHTHAHTHTPM